MSAQVLPLRKLEEDVWKGIEQAAETTSEELKKHLEKPELVIVKRTRTIAGFQLASEEEKNKSEKYAEIEVRLQQRKKILEKTRRKASEFREALQRNKIEPIAVLPRNIWQALCEEGGLYRFEAIGKDGMVRCANPSESFSFWLGHLLLQSVVVLGFALFSNVPFQTIGISFLALLASGALVLLRLKKDAVTESWDTLLIIFALICFSNLPAIILMTSPSIFVKGTSVYVTLFFGPMLALIMVSGPSFLLGIAFKNGFFVPLSVWSTRFLMAVVDHKTICKLLWPSKFDLVRDLNQKIKIRFPDPPEDVIDILRAPVCADYGINVAIVDDAIGIEARGFAESIYVKAQLDPIIYLKNRDGDFVAIVAQFGDFPIEQEIIDKIGSVSFLPLL